VVVVGAAVAARLVRCRSINYLPGAAKRDDCTIERVRTVQSSEEFGRGGKKGQPTANSIPNLLAPIVARTQSSASRAAHGPGSYPQSIIPPIRQSTTSRGTALRALLERKTR
jgi:hypothetical protein